MRKLIVLALTAFMVAGGIAAAQAKSAYSVTLAVNHTKVDLGSAIVLSGKVSPSAKGQTVKIQRRIGSGSWTTLRTVTLSSSSTYRATYKPTKAGPQQYRVQKVASSSNSAGNSATRSLDVYRWRWLYDVPTTFEPEAGYFSGGYPMAGEVYQKSISLKSGDSISWSVNANKCTKLKVYMGIDDDSAVGTSGTDTILTGLLIDGAEGTFERYDDPTYVVRNIGGWNSVTFQFVKAQSSGTNVYGMFGAPQVYCNS